MSSDDQVIASAANGTLKIWNSRTTACLRTLEGGYAICSTFLPGDRHVSLLSPCPRVPIGSGDLQNTDADFRWSSAPNPANSSYTTSPLPPFSPPTKRIPNPFGASTCGQTGEAWSAVARTRMSSSGISRCAKQGRGRRWLVG